MTYSDEVSKLIAEGNRAYSAKDYDKASEKYGEACEAFSEDKGEEDADLLFLYGKALFQGAVSKSEVFGGKPTNDNTPGPEDEESKDEKDGENKEEDEKFQFFDAAPLAEEEEEKDGESNEIPRAVEEEDEDEEKNEEEGDKGHPEQEPEEEEQSDFEVAWEILDLTRNLFELQLEDLKEEGKDLTVPYLQTDTEETENQFIIVTKKLSETYDLLGEVSLEAENFPQSALDLESALKLRLKLYNPENSSLISESHYKLSLALEFCVEDPTSREKAVEQMKLAIESVKKRTDKEIDEKKKHDNEELLQDLDVRYQELLKDPQEELQNEQLNIIKGLLGEATGEQKSSEGTSSAAVNDLSGAIRKKAQVNDLTAVVKKRKAPSKAPGQNSGNEKKPRSS
ncbi:uncharacterized protein RJT20DRAFT_42364 [Scheffersomyces xylosifermentans]|uniref:uncharacterized protein n=1 Tax=Scheffersomyces xylosifermentans TaxID=1304137 RepID=UPI00315CB69D